MNRNVTIAATAAFALGLAACNEPTPEGPPKTTSTAPPPAPASPPAASAAAAAPTTANAKPAVSPRAQLDVDLQLSRKVKAAVGEGASGHIEVAANDGVVTLYGTVDAPADRERMALVAMGVEGVRSVVNNLVVLQGS